MPGGPSVMFPPWTEHPIWKNLVEAWSEHPIVKDVQKHYEPAIKNLHHVKIIHPADMYWVDDEHIQVKVDLAGFDENQVTTKLRGNVLSISAKRKSIVDLMEDANKKIKTIVTHRPTEFWAALVVPFTAIEGKEPGVKDDPCSIVNGVLTIDILNVTESTTINSSD